MDELKLITKRLITGRINLITMVSTEKNKNYLVKCVHTIQLKNIN